MAKIWRSCCLPLVCVAALAACGADDEVASVGPDTSTVVAERSDDSSAATRAAEGEAPTVTAPDRPTLMVAGDSIMYDVAPALVEALDPSAATVLTVVAPSLAAESSRVTLIDRVEASHPDLLVVMVGVWERAHVTASGFVLGDAGFGAEYLDEALEPVVEAVSSAGGRLLILGPPHLREDTAERQIIELERIWTSFATANPGVVDFVDADAWLGAGPAFVEIEQQGSTTTRLRRTDGIHLCAEGARRIASGVLSVLATSSPDVTPTPPTGWEKGAWTDRFPADECPAVG